MEICSIVWIDFQCFQLDKNAPKFFGFSEFFTGLALMILAWTISDVRYRFRINTAFIPLKEVSFFIVFAIGTLVLITDLWRAQQGWVPVGSFMTPELWQFFLGSLYFLTIFTWMWCAFIKPAKFSTTTANRYLKAVNESILQGSPSELAIIADELARSAARIVRAATEKTEEINQADLLLHAIGSNKFCKATLQGAPILISELFNEISSQKKYQIDVEIFTKNIVTAAIENKSSFLYNEIDYYESGFEGVSKPITSALCRDPDIIKNIDTLLFPNHSRNSSWDIEQWRAYFRLFRGAFPSSLKINDQKFPKSIHWALSLIPSIYGDLTSSLQLTKLSIHDDLYMRLNELTDLIKYMVTQIDEYDDVDTQMLLCAKNSVADLIYSLIESSSSVRSPRNVARRIQDEIIWQDLMNSSELRTSTGLEIQGKVHCKLLSVISKCPNLDSVRILGYCLNVLGFHPPQESDAYGNSWREFHNNVLEWVESNIADLLDRFSRMENECFVDGMSYDAENCRLVITYSSDNTSKVSCEYLHLRRKNE